MPKSLLIFLLVYIWISPEESIAQDAALKKWHSQGNLYAMFPNIKGETTVANLPEVEVDAAEADILGNLKFGAMFYLETTNDDWAISSDYIYMKLNKGLETTNLIKSSSITMEQLAWEENGVKHLKPWLEVGLGGRLVLLSTEIAATGVSNKTRASSAKKYGMTL